jgi:basic amino acid/polyamine antiporter, APA family
MDSARQDQKATAPQAHLSLWDTICIIVGIIIGTGIFITPGAVFALSGGPLQALAVWAAGGLLAIVGAFCFAELASTYPRSGGEYVYLTRAFGPWAGFLFAWGQLLIIRTGASIVVMGFAFADYAVRLARLDESSELPAIYTTLALLPIILLTLVNILGVRSGKWTQNALTVVKVLGLSGVLVAGFVWGKSRMPGEDYVVQQGRIIAATANHLDLSMASYSLAREAKITIDGRETDEAGNRFQPVDVQGLRARVLAYADKPTFALQIKATRHGVFGALSLALVFVLWTYAGWHEGGYIAAEVRNRRRNLPWALLLGTAAVIAIYLLVNVAYLVGLGYEGAADSQEVAADVLALVPGGFGEPAICVLILISALGAINGLIYTSSRIFTEFGSDHSLFAPLGRWSGRFGTPVTALVVQAVVCVITILVVAFFFQSKESFDAVLKGTAPVFWLFFLVTGFALFALRRLDRDIERPFPVPWYPLTPLLYCAICGLMLYGSVAGAFEERLGGLFVVLTGLLVLAGFPLYWLSRNKQSRLRAIDPDRDQKVQTIIGD